MRTRNNRLGESAGRKWGGRIGHFIAGVGVGAVAGLVLLVAVVAVVLLYCWATQGNSSSNSSTGSLPDGAWKLVLALILALGFAATCYYFADWIGVLVGGASLGGLCGGLLGLGLRFAYEKKRRIEMSN